METEIRYSERSPRPFESRDASLTSDDVNELCRRWIEAERERTRALLTELLVQINNDVIPEVVATLPDLRGPPGPAGPAGKLPIAKSGNAKRSTTKVKSSPAMAPLIRPFATPACRPTKTRRIGFVSPLRVAMLNHFVIAAPSKMMLSMSLTTSSRSTGARFWHCMTSPAHVLAPDGNYWLRRASAASLAKKARPANTALRESRVSPARASRDGSSIARVIWRYRSCRTGPVGRCSNCAGCLSSFYTKWDSSIRHEQSQQSL
jgi:hypothetical protein